MFIRPCEGRITSPFGYRIHPITHNRLMHWGIDIAKSGTVPIHASANGKVTFAKFTNGYGNTVMIEHLIGGKLYTTVYAHLASIAVRLNQDVKVGQSVGAMGNTGNSTGQHLHFEVHVGKWNNKFTNAVNPLLYMIDPDTKVIQLKLIKAGYKITADGIAGPLTDKAIREFQRASGLVADGIAGKSTHAALDKVKTTPQKKEVDEMTELLPDTQKKDMKTLLQRAYNEKVFTVNHTPKVDKMTRGQATDLVISYVARTK